MLTDDIIWKSALPSPVLLEDTGTMRTHGNCGRLAAMQQLIRVGQTHARGGEEAVGPCPCGNVAGNFPPLPQGRSVVDNPGKSVFSGGRFYFSSTF